MSSSRRYKRELIGYKWWGCPCGRRLLGAAYYCLCRRIHMLWIATDFAFAVSKRSYNQHANLEYGSKIYCDAPIHGSDNRG